jgi:hypothetical protein
MTCEATDPSGAAQVLVIGVAPPAMRWTDLSVVQAQVHELAAKARSGVTRVDAGLRRKTPLPRIRNLKRLTDEVETARI